MARMRTHTGQTHGFRWIEPPENLEKLVGEAGFEPTTTRTPSVCATRLRYSPLFTLVWTRRAHISV